MTNSDETYNPLNLKRASLGFSNSSTRSGFILDSTIKSIFKELSEKYKIPVEQLMKIVRSEFECAFHYMNDETQIHKVRLQYFGEFSSTIDILKVNLETPPKARVYAHKVFLSKLEEPLPKLRKYNKSKNNKII